MPFGRSSGKVYGALKRGVLAAGYSCLRVDKTAFTADVVERILTEIRNCKVVIGVATGRNPNVFYELGYAMALGKEVVTVVDSYSDLPFNVRNKNAIQYGQDMRALERQVRTRLLALSRIRRLD